MQPPDQARPLRRHLRRHLRISILEPRFFAFFLGLAGCLGPDDPNPYAKGYEEDSGVIPDEGGDDDSPVWIDDAGCDGAVPSSRHDAVGVFVSLPVPYTRTTTEVNAAGVEETMDWGVERGILYYGGWNAAEDVLYNDLWLFDLTNLDQASCPWVEISGDAVPDGARADAAMAADGSAAHLYGGYRQLSDGTVETSSAMYTLDLDDLEAGFVAAGSAGGMDVTAELIPADTSPLDCAGTTGPSCYTTSESGGCVWSYTPSGFDRCTDLFEVPQEHTQTTLGIEAGDTFSIWEGCHDDPICTSTYSTSSSEHGRAGHALVLDPGTGSTYAIGGAWGCSGPSCDDDLFVFGDEGRASEKRDFNVESVEEWSSSGFSEAVTDWDVAPSDWPDATYGRYGVAGVAMGVEWDGDSFEETSGGFAAHIFGGNYFQAVSPAHEHYIEVSGNWDYHDCGDYPEAYNLDGWNPYNPSYTGDDPLTGTADLSRTLPTTLQIMRWDGSTLSERSMTNSGPAATFNGAAASLGPYDALYSGGWDGSLNAKTGVYRADMSSSPGTWFSHHDLLTARAGHVMVVDPVTKTAFAMGGASETRVERHFFDETVLPDATSSWEQTAVGYSVEMTGADAFTLGAQLVATHTCGEPGCFGTYIPIVVGATDVAEVEGAAITVTLPDSSTVLAPVLDAEALDDTTVRAIAYLDGATVSDGDEVTVDIQWSEAALDRTHYAFVGARIARVVDSAGARVFVVKGGLGGIGDDATALQPDLLATWTVTPYTDFVATGPGAWTRPTSSSDPWVFSGSPVGPVSEHDMVVLVEDGVDMGDTTTAAGTLRVVRSPTLPAATVNAISDFVSGAVTPSLGTMYERLGDLFGASPQSGVQVLFLEGQLAGNLGLTRSGQTLVMAQRRSGASVPVKVWSETTAHELAHQWVGEHGIVDSGDNDVWWLEGTAEAASWVASVESTMTSPQVALDDVLDVSYNSGSRIPLEHLGGVSDDVYVTGQYSLSPLILTDVIYLTPTLGTFWSSFQTWASTLADPLNATNADFQSFIESDLALTGVYSQWTGTRMGVPLLALEDVSLDRGTSTLSIGLKQAQNDMVASWTDAYVAVPYVIACSKNGVPGVAAMSPCAPLSATTATAAALTSTSTVVSGAVDLASLGPNALLKIKLYSMPYLHPSALVPHAVRRSGVAAALAWCENAAGACALDGDTDGVPSGFVPLAYDCDDSDPAVMPFQSGAGEAGDTDGVDNNCDGWELP